MAGVRDLPLEERRGLVEQAGLRNWPVGIRVTRTKTAYGVTTAHHHATGSLVAFTSVGGHLTVSDLVLEKPDGTVEVVQGVASALLEVCEQTNLRIVA